MHFAWGTKMADPQIEYFGFLCQAQEAAHAVAAFVIDEGDSDSVAAIEQLLRRERTCNLALIRYVRDNLTALDAYFILPEPLASQVSSRPNTRQSIVDT